MEKTKIHLQPGYFTDLEKTLVEEGPLSAQVFRYPSGVCGLRLQNEQGSLTLLPFQGQQIWRAVFAGRELTMKSMFPEPRPTSAYLETYGGFLVHCGATAMGVPSAEDTHPLHGELPNAVYQKAYLTLGQDQAGSYIGLGGLYQHTVAFSTNYLAEPQVRLYAGASLFQLDMGITNLKNSEMELMYMAHVNFRPVDHGRLVYSALCTPDHVRVRRSIPSHVRPKPGYVEFIEELAQAPEKHNHLSPGLLFDPEVVFNIEYLADGDGWAHSLQVHQDGSADYIRHRPEQLKVGVRWICRTADQDALGLVLPSTAEPEGYLAEKAKGNILQVGPGEVFRCSLEMGRLDPGPRQEVERKIERILAK